MNNTCKKVVSWLVSTSMLLSQTTYATTVTSQERTQSIIDNLMKNAGPSELPFIDYMDSFHKEKSQLIKGFDLSDFKGRDLYVGYGIFDEDQKYCKYIEKPDLHPESTATDKITTYFDINSIKLFNKHSYAKSIQTMTFDQCKNYAAKFGGYPVVPNATSENLFITTTYSGDKWIGIERENCDSQREYVDPVGLDQIYFNWNPYETMECQDSKRKVIMESDGKWAKATGTESKYCIIEVDSEDITRPVKFCAPWWRVERDYEAVPKAFFGGINVYKINQADIPEQFTVCTKVKTSALEEAQETGPYRVDCTTYYQATLSDKCLKNPIQSDCFVDECAGYIKNTCVLQGEMEPYKNYTKTKALINGSLKWIKDKQQITTHIYECPATPPITKDTCEEQSQVIIYPKECPGSQCDLYKQCIEGAFPDKTREDCFNDYSCKKIYGNPDLPVFDSSGELTALQGYCKDENGENVGEPLVFPVNIQNKLQKKCIEYNMIEKTFESVEVCKASKSYEDHTVETSLTSKDIYEDDPNCIRLNNVQDARPIQEMTFEYVNNGFSKLLIKKAYLDGSEETTVEAGDGEYIANPGTEAAQPVTEEAQIQVETPPEPEYQCPEITEEWMLSITTLLDTKPDFIISSSYLSSDDFKDETQMEIRFTEISSEVDCAKKMGVIPFGKTYAYSETAKTCDIFYPKSDADKLFKKITGYDPIYYFTSETVISKEECQRLSGCMGGEFNEDDFGTTNNTCVITVSNEDYAEPADPQIEELPEPEPCQPPTIGGAIQTKIDGNKDVFFIEDVVPGDFGYYSNHTTWPYTSSVVSFENKQLFPIKEITQIKDNLVYDSIFKQNSIAAKKPRFFSGLIGSASAGGAATYYGAAMIGVGTAALAGAYIVLALFGKTKKYNELYTHWVVYKMVPKDRLIASPYDYRLVELDASGSPKIYPGNLVKVIYLKNGEDPRLEGWDRSNPAENIDFKKSFTGTFEPPDYKILVGNLFKTKQQKFMCSGWDKAYTPYDSIETEVVTTYKKCKWYDLSCRKVNSTVRAPLTDPFVKTMSNYYKGATNTVSIVVPYLGDYTVKAYDKNDNLLGELNVLENDFIGEEGGRASFAQVMFGLVMSRANFIPEGTTTGACRYDPMVEWGGGVSGIYYENDFTGLYKGCSKSNDNHVRDHSAVKLTVQSLGSDTPFVIKLDKPLPFANRVFLVTMGDKEVRKYRCFQDFESCDEEDYIVSDEE